MQQNGYLKLTMGPTTQRCYYISPFDVTEFSKAYLEAEVPAINFASSTCLALEARTHMENWHGQAEKDDYYVNTRLILGRNGNGELGRGLWNCSFDYKGELCITVCRNAGSASVGATVNIYNLWLEK